MFKKLLYLALGLGLCAFALSYALPSQPVKFQSSELNNNFISKGSFENYIANEKQVIKKARVDLTASNQKAVINGNAPFELLPPKYCTAKNAPGGHYKNGILLIHGLSGSPYVMKRIGQVFQKNCFFVAAVLLPGMGTRPGDMDSIKWEDWDKAVKYGLSELANKAENVYIAGYSIGGTLAIHESLHNPHVRGLFLFSPAIAIASTAKIAGILTSLGRICPRLKWVNVAEDKDIYRYESMSMNGAYQAYRLIEKIKKELHGQVLSLPIFIALSQDDTTVNSQATIQFLKDETNNTNDDLVLYTADTHAINKLHLKSKIEIINSYFPKKKILSSAHTAILISPDDSYYGFNGAYGCSCVHYTLASKAYSLCKQQHYNYSGEITPVNLKRGIIGRLMYNPNFSKLETSLQHFIKQLNAKE